MSAAIVALAEALATLRPETLRALAARLPAHLTPATLGALRLQSCGVPAAAAQAAAAALRGDDAPATIDELRRLLVLLASERARLDHERERTTLLWTRAGGASGASELRDALVVTAELLRGAERSVLLSTFTWHLESPTWMALLDRAREVPALAITLVLEPGEQRRRVDDADSIRAAVRGDVLAAWPSALRPPQILVPQASLARYEPGAAGIHHAKFAVVDARRLLVTSANFTFAGALANIELGVLLDCPRSAAAVLREVEGAVREGVFVRVA